MQGSRKWIGTTEVAVVLRYFGMNALIVDFTDKRKCALDGGGKKGAANQQNGNNNSNTEEVHLNVQCDSCGTKPIIGPRYKSMVLPDYHLCAKCHQNQGGDGGPVAPFQRMMATGMRNTGNGGNGSGDDGGAGGKQQLLNWIWNYFERQISPCSFGNDDHEDNGLGENETKKPKLLNGGGGRHNDNDKVVVTNAGPLYFQHEGHSRTIIGIEKRLVIGTHNNNTLGSSSSSSPPQYQLCLLILDPSIDKRVLQNALERGQGWQKLLRRGGHTLKHSQWQLLYVPPLSLGGVVMSEEEKEKLKKITASERY